MLFLLLFQLIQASNDTVMNVSNTDIEGAICSDFDGSGHTRSGVYGGGSGRSSPSLLSARMGSSGGRKYWASRFYAFLSKMTELSTAIKDESSIDDL
jgi:hypothetical protein